MAGVSSAGRWPTSGKDVQLVHVQMLAELFGRANRDCPVAVSPDHKARCGEMRFERAAQAVHVLMPCAEELEQMGHGAGRAEVVAVGLEALGRVPALGAGHAAEAEHLHPLWVPRHGVREQATWQREIEADEGVGLFKVGVRWSYERERTELVGVERRHLQSNGATMRVAHDDGAVDAKCFDGTGDVLRGELEAGVDVSAALGVACSGKVESNDVQRFVEGFHQRKEGFGTAHEAMQHDDRRRILGHRTFFEVREPKAVKMKLAAFDHSWRFFSV